MALAEFPYASGAAHKKRPVLVIQSDAYNQRIDNIIVAEITSNLKNANDPAHLLIDISTSEGQAMGLVKNSLVSCLNLATLRKDRLKQVIGSLSAALIRQVADCLKIALTLP